MRCRLIAVVVMAIAWTGPADGDDWPRHRGAHGDGVWRETGIVEKLPARPSYRWRTPLGAGFAGPAVAGGRVYVADRIVPSHQQVPEARWDRTDPVEGVERVHCLDLRSGKILWTHEYPCRYTISYPSGPRATPTVYQGKVYALGAMGDLRCLDARTGRLVWSKNYVRDFGTQMNTWGMAAAPWADGQRLLVLCGGKDHAGLMALDKDSGRELWRALDCPDPGYSAPVLIEAQGVRQLLVWCPTGLYSVDPATGKVYWSQPAEVKMGHSIASPVYDAPSGLVFVTSFFDGPIMMKLDPNQPTARLLWKGRSNSELPRRTDGLHGLMSTPVIRDGYLYGVCSYGHLRGLDAFSGKRLWETLAPTGEARWSTAFITEHQGRFFLFNEHGDLILAKFSPQGYEALGRMHVIEPTTKTGGRLVVWSPPAFADRCLLARNDQEIVCVELAAPSAPPPGAATNGTVPQNNLGWVAADRSFPLPSNP
jgi:outer membrane protein assembly factor BamB